MQSSDENNARRALHCADTNVTVVYNRKLMRIFDLDLLGANHDALVNLDDHLVDIVWPRDLQIEDARSEN